MKKRVDKFPDAAEMLVVRSTGSEYLVQPVGQPHAEIISATLRGKFRLRGFKLTNPIAVGDHVRVTLDDRRIVELLPRDNYLLRASTHREHYSQILCSNIDQAVMVFSIEYPFTPLGFLDSFLVMCEAYHIPAVVVFNKIDRINEDKHQFKLEDFSMAYHEIGYTVKHMVATDEAFRDKAEEVLLNKRSFLCGKSGAGKSTLVNLVDPNLNLRTQSISEYSDKGQHTTTFAELFWLQGGGSVIDAPGLNEFTITGIEWYELQGYYPEMRARMNDCKFNNCVHYHEPDCAIRAAVEAGDIAQSRYNTYISMLTTLRPKLLKE